MLRPDLSADYALWLSELKTRIAAAQQRAGELAMKLNF